MPNTNDTPDLNAARTQDPRATADPTTTVQLRFLGGYRVAAQVGTFTVHTDQPVSLGGENSAPSPYELFLASLASCAGYYALAFLNARGIQSEGLAIRQLVESDVDTHLPRKIRLQVELPRGVPPKYQTALVRAIEHCKVKQAIQASPSFEVEVHVADEAEQQPRSAQAS